MEWKRPSANDHFRLGKEAVALLATSRAGRAWRQVACRREGGPSLAHFTVKPASRVDQPDLRIARLDLGPVIGADPLGSQHVDGSHEGIPPCAAIADNRWLIDEYGVPGQIILRARRDAARPGCRPIPQDEAGRGWQVKL